MEVILVDEASVEFEKHIWGIQTRFVPTDGIFCETSLKFNHVTGKYTQRKLENKMNSLLNMDEMEISYEIRITRNKEDTEDNVDIKWGSHGEQSLFFTIPSNVKASAGIQMRIELDDENIYRNVSPIYPLKNFTVRDDFCGVVTRLSDVPVGLINRWKEECENSGKVTITLIFDDECIITYILNSEPPSMNSNYCHSVLAKMLENENGGDTVINGANGQTVKCHRAVLEASCAYFETVLKSGMQESTTNTIDMSDSDLDESEIRAFLGYLYTGDVKPAIRNIQMAWKLLKAGNYYRHDKLLGAMRQIVMIKAHEKFTVDLALDMLIFAKQMCDSANFSREQCLDNVWSDVSLKAVHVLKWYMTEKPLELLESEKYKKLHEDSPQLAMQLHAKFIQISDPDAIEKEGVNWLKNI